MKKAAFATSVKRRANCCRAEPKKRDKPIKNDKIKNVFLSAFNSDEIFFISNKQARGMIARKPIKNLTELNVKGPISSIPVSWAMKVVPQMNVHIRAHNNEAVLDIILEC